MSNKSLIIRNVILSTATQVITLALGMILPKVILLNWGSEYNGLINSITTVMRYLSLLEAGISASTLQALYKAFGEKDLEQVSSVVKTAQNYYRRIALVYVGCVMAISLIYPLMLNTEIPYWEIVVVILLQGCTGVLNFAFRAAYQQVLNAEGKYYTISVISLFNTVLTYAVKIIAVDVFNSIIVMQILGLLVMGIQVLAYAVYFGKKYSWIDKSKAVDNSLLKNKTCYMVQQLAGLVYRATDTVVLSLFCGLKVVSVYSIYSMVYSAVTVMVGIARNSTNFVLGQAFHDDIQKFEKVYRGYTSFQIGFGCMLASCSMVLIMGFIELYTRGISDANYINYFAAVLFSLDIILDCFRGASLAAANIAGRAPNTTWRYIVEASANFLLSLVLVQYMGMNGVLLGTVVSGVWRTIDSVYYFNTKVLGVSPMKEFLFGGLNICVFAVFCGVGKLFRIYMPNYAYFLFWGVITLSVTGIAYGGIYILLNRDVFRNLISMKAGKRETST